MFCNMNHRHLNHNLYSLAAIESVITRGQWKDWADMRRAILADHSLLDKVERICQHYLTYPPQRELDFYFCKLRYHFWSNYVKKVRETLA